MAPTILYLPDGLSLTVTLIFGGLYFKSNELSQSAAPSPFPPGWTVVMNTIDTGEQLDCEQLPATTNQSGQQRQSKCTTLPYQINKPTLQHDQLFISSISQPPSSEFRPPSSQVKQIAMMLWATLYWYFQQNEPPSFIHSKQSKATPDAGKPKADWRIAIKAAGVFKGTRMLRKLERMGLVASEDSSVGPARDDTTSQIWLDMFVSRSVFWQIDPSIYLFSLSPTSGSPFPGDTPVPSRPGSPARSPEERIEFMSNISTGRPEHPSAAAFSLSSHLPTFYPPAPTQYVFTAGVRHPLRTKPGRQGDILYNRYIPSFKQYLSFRIALIGPIKPRPLGSLIIDSFKITAALPVSDSTGSMIGTRRVDERDVDLLHKWMNQPRVSKFWGVQGPRETQEAMLKEGLRSRHSVPLIGCWDGIPFGYFELYWVKEDPLGRLLGDVGNFDRGIHCLVGEQEFRGEQRVKVWLSSLVHHCWLSDNRTEVVLMEPRIDNEKYFSQLLFKPSDTNNNRLLRYAMNVGFYKEKEIAFPHKQANLLKIRRDGWQAPTL